ncbi:MAG: CSLREA domain-containing protein [Anaerolinea sp.]|nr:CSLREA domain-containing protein [Anaerolinea sp.]
MKTVPGLPKFFVLLALLFLWGSSPVQPALAATIDVNTTADEFGTGTDCSLREAIQAANTDTAFGGCSAGSGDDIINLPAGTYTLSISGSGENSNATGDLDIASNITVIGAGAGQTTINANSIDRVLHILSGNVALQDLSITGGLVNEVSGGGILQNGGSLTIENSIVSANSKTGSAGFGGGVAHTNGTLVIRDSTLANNTSATSGGGLYTTVGSADIETSTFSSNAVTGGGGGAIYSVNNTVNVVNATFNGNTITTNGGAIFVPSGSTGQITINNSTFYNNAPASGTGRAIRNLGSNPTILDNTLLLRGAAAASLCSGSFTASNSLANDTSCTGTSTTITNFDTTLRDNGGPTLTHAILPGSNAIDAGNNATCATVDQRGLSRPVDYDLNSTVTCDIGAFERQAGETFTATVNDGDTVTFGATLTTIVDVAGGNAPGQVTVTRINQPPGGGAPDAGEMPFHVNITAATSTGLDIDLTLCYTDWELTHNTTSVVESGLTLYRWNSALSVWEDQGVDALDTTNNCATKNNVSALSSWTLASGPPEPTAVSLQSFSATNPATGLLLFGSALILTFIASLFLRRRVQG